MWSWMAFLATISTASTHREIWERARKEGKRKDLEMYLTLDEAFRGQLLMVALRAVSKRVGVLRLLGGA